MKKIIITGALLISSFIFAQNVEPKFEVVDKMVKATYYHDNGQVKQEGFYLDGKLHGKWVSYNNKGVKETIGEYDKGDKVGKWFFWNANQLSEVDFSNSRIVEVKKWSSESLVKN